MLILGINNMHDASAALIYNGHVVAAAEEERFNRIKHTTGFPLNAISYCMKEANITIRDIDFIAVGWKYWVLKTRVLQALRSVVYSPAALKAKAERGIGQMRNEWFELFRMKKLIQRYFGKGNFRLFYIDHHLSHAASSFFVSPFDKSAILTIDGAGEEITTMFAAGEGERIRVLKKIKLPHSLGQFYSAITSLLGFKVQSDEYKVMGLAAYGEPVYYDFFKKIVKILPKGEFKLNIEILDYHLARKGIFSKRLIEVIGPPRKKGEPIEKRHADIAASAQKIIEEGFLHLTSYLYDLTKIKNLCMAGGVALNSVANGKVFLFSPFEKIFIQPASSDAGTSVGAALYLYYLLKDKRQDYIMEHAYLGPQFSQKECEEAVAAYRLKYEIFNKEKICKIAAEALNKGKLVFWFQGRMEWGPRALGNRSLLADPRKKQVREIINKKIKKREGFRPFAPSILEEYFEEYFGINESFPFMLFTFKVVPEKRALIPAVIHVDGTARPQTVSKKTNPYFWKLINYFKEITGVPVVLNTSFNVREPIVCTPKDAINTFLKTDVDFLALENVWIKNPKKGG